MTREQAKELLLSCRLNTADQTEPEFAEALELAMSDPELNQWLNDQQKFHATIRAEMRRVRPPTGLKERILAGAPKPRATVRWGRPEVWALAAAIALVLGGAAFWLLQAPRDEKNLANFSSRMISFALRTYEMDVITSDRDAVRNYLKDHGAPADFPLTPGLEKMPVKGGGRLTWQNEPVAMMCFDLPAKDTAFMFVIDEKPFGKATLPETARVASGMDLHTAIWRKNGRIYLLAVPGRPEVAASLAAP
jgi:hypothetical protein